MKCPESTASVRSAGSACSRAIESVLGSIRSGAFTSSKGWCAHEPRAIRSSQIRRTPASRVHPGRFELRGQRAGRRGRVPDDARVGVEVTADRVRVDIHLHDLRPCATRWPCRVDHMFSVAPNDSSRSAPPMSSAASGDANPPVIPSDHGLPANRPLATADVASSAPMRSASSSSAGPAPQTRRGRR